MSLDQVLSTLGQSLILRIDQDAQIALEKLAQEYNIQGIYVHEETGNDWTYQRDLRVQGWCKKPDKTI